MFQIFKGLNLLMHFCARMLINMNIPFKTANSSCLRVQTTKTVICIPFSKYEMCYSSQLL